MTEPLLLVADVGGTNTRVGLARGVSVDPGSVRRFRNAEAPHLESVLARYLAEAQVVPDAAAAAGAGPLQDGRVHLTNLAWTVSPEGLTEATGCSTVSVMNDLQAQGHAVRYIDTANLTSVFNGARNPDPDATRLVIGVGTGLNIALVLCVDGRSHVPPSEAGHMDLPGGQTILNDLAAWVAARHGYAGAEEFLSGRGVAELYRWACAQAGVAAEDALDAQIVLSHLTAGNPQAQEAARAFALLLGTYAASLALIQLPFGGIYLSGGVSRAMAPWLDQMGFAAAFLAKGRFSTYMRQFSVNVIEDDFAALTGCAAHLTGQIAPLAATLRT